MKIWFDPTQQKHIYGYRHPRALSPSLLKGSLRSAAGVCLFPPPSLGLCFLFIIQATFLALRQISTHFCSLWQSQTALSESRAQVTSTVTSSHVPPHPLLLCYSLVLRCAPSRVTARG